MRGARVAGALAEGRSVRRQVLEQLEYATAAEIDVGVAQAHAGEPDDPVELGALVGALVDHPQAEQVAIEAQSGFDAADRDAGVVESAHRHGRSRSGTTSRAKTSSIVSARRTISASPPLTRTIAGRGKALKLAAQASS